MKNYIKNICIIMCALLLVFTSCETEEFETINEIQDEIETQDAESIEIDYYGSMVKATKITKNQYLIDGSDIAIRVNFDQNNKAAFAGDGFLWPNNTVYYRFDNLSSTNQSRMKTAIAHWEARTTIKFVQRTNQSNYINIEDDENGCYANVGMVGGPQIFNIECGSTGSMIHELGHSMGLYHEQSRSDRDDYINVISSNSNYTIKDGDVYGPFDFDSIMIYSSGSAMSTLNGGSWIGQRDMLSVHDVRAIEHFYSTGSAKIAIRASNLKWVSSQNGEEPIASDRNSIAAWEKLDLLHLSNGKIALRGSNGRYVSSENGLKSMTCVKTKIGAWEEFELQMYNDNTFTLKGNNGKYVTGLNGNGALICNRSKVGAWETFKMYGQD